MRDSAIAIWGAIFALGVLTLLNGCGGPDTVAPAGLGGGRNMDPGKMSAIRQNAARYEEYVDALTLFGDRDASGWLIGAERLRKLDRESALSDDDRRLLIQFGDPNPKTAASARTELARRGSILTLLKLYDLKYAKGGTPQPIDYRQWETAMEELQKLSVNNDAINLLVDMLARRLIDERFISQHYYIRNIMVKIGKPAADLLAHFAGELAARIEPGKLHGRYENALVQSLVILSLMGDDGRSIISAFARHEKAAVRAAVAPALGETRDPADIDILDRLLSADTEWEVRARAAEALGNIPVPRSGLILRRAIKDERDESVLKSAVRSLGRIKCKEAIGDLVGILRADRGMNIQGEAVKALCEITGVDRLNPEWWIGWWAERESGAK